MFNMLGVLSIHEDRRKQLHDEVKRNDETKMLNQTVKRDACQGTRACWHPVRFGITIRHMARLTVSLKRFV